MTVSAYKSTKIFLVVGLGLYLSAPRSLFGGSDALHTPPAGAMAHGTQAPTAAAASSSVQEENCREGQGCDAYDIIHIDIPGAVWSQAAEITNHRVVSGDYGDALGGVHSFLWFNGLTVTIDKPGESITAVAAISAKGLMFGNWGTETEQHAGYYDPTTATWTQLPDIAGYPLNIGSRMNETGQAVGSACSGGTFDISTGCKGWLWDGHKYQLYSVPGAMDTFPNGINNKAVQVGIYELQPGVYPGFRRYHDRFLQLVIQTPSGPLSPTAYDINENGTILGVANLDPNDYFPSILIYPRGGYKVLPKDTTVVRTFYLGMNEREDLAGSWFNDPAAGYFALVALRKHADHER